MEGGVDDLPKNILASCPNFYETVEKKRGSLPYYKPTYESENILRVKSIISAHKTLKRNICFWKHGNFIKKI